MYTLGAIKSHRDDRDYHLAKLIPVMGSFPEEFEIPYNHSIKNQGSIGKCVAESLSYNRAILEEKQSNEYHEFSEDYIYANRAESDYQESGMIPREALKQLMDCGTVYKEDFPYESEYPEILNYFNTVRESLKDKAYPHRITAYASLNTDDEIKTALMKLGPVLAVYRIYDSFFTTGKEGLVHVPNEYGEKLYGYHAMTIVGWRKDNTWVVLNSWGDSWGDKGKCYIPFKIYQEEIWSITDTIVPEKEEKIMDGLVIMESIGDLASALNLQYKFGYPIIEQSYVTPELLRNAKIIIKVGGSDIPTPDTILLSGDDRIKTDEVVINYINTH